jgi:short-subunit dehydrogenase
MQLNNKWILLTGASGGIGSAIAKTLCVEGANLLLVGRNQSTLDTLSSQLDKRHRTIQADINDTTGREKVISECSQLEPGLDVLINAAGVMDFQLFENQSAGCVQQIIQTNLMTPMLLCQQLIPLLKCRPEAAIINVGSIFGSIGHPGFTAYCTSKFGLRGFTEALKRELADTPINISYLAPRATQTPLNSDTINELNSILGNKTDTPELVAKELITLLHKQKAFVYMGWPEKLFVRVNALLPNLVHSALVKKLPIIKEYAEKQSK